MKVIGLKLTRKRLVTDQLNGSKFMGLCPHKCFFSLKIILSTCYEQAYHNIVALYRSANYTSETSQKHT